jgi:hypothetical protein
MISPWDKSDLVEHYCDTGLDGWQPSFFRETNESCFDATLLVSENYENFAIFGFVSWYPGAA